VGGLNKAGKMIVSKNIKTLMQSVSIPLGIVLLAFLQSYFEQTFRYSIEYRYIYNYGSTIRFLLQILLILLGFIIGLDLIFRQRQNLSRKYRILSSLIAIAPLLYIVMTIIISF
jgi:tellurite resistance protein TehA-like permease